MPELDTVKWTDILTVLILLVTIAAIIWGPIRAVQIADQRDQKKGKLERKHAIFSTLMKTRQARLSGDHVGALNLIQLEFYEAPEVLSAYKLYIEHLNQALPAPDLQETFISERQDRFVELFAAIGKDLDYKFDKHELSRLAYAPIAWNDNETLQRENATLLSQILKGNRGFPITTAPLTTNTGPFPAAPE